MTEMKTTEIETVTVTFEELKANLRHYMWVKETKRVSVIRDGKEVAVLGPWLPGEERIATSEWFEFYRDLFPPEPVDMTNRVSRALEEQRGNLPST
jgi:hypothetical protein